MKSKELYEAAQRWMAGKGDVGMNDVVRACLAEHKPDDDEPVTEEWLNSVIGADGICTMSSDDYAEEIVHIYGVGDVRIPMPRSRGRFRSLFSGLGIKLNEPA